MTRRSTRRDRALAQFASDVRYYLSQQPRQLPSRYFYDDLGSALFDAICRLPWYGVTRAELRLLARHGARDPRARAALLDDRRARSGNGEKLVALRRSARRRCGTSIFSSSTSRPARSTLSSHALAALPNVDVVDARGARTKPAWRGRRPQRGRAARWSLFLGSNIGNFDRPGARRVPARASAPA